MAKEEQAKTEESTGTDKKKLYIIIGAAVAAVVVIIVVVLMLSGKGKDKEAKEEGGHGQKAESAEGAAKGPAAEAVYPLEPFIVNIYDGQEIRYLKVKVEFGLASPEAKAELDPRQAPLRDAILVLLTTKTMQDIQDMQGKNQLREEILAAVNGIVPPGKVLKVFFTDFVVQ